ncbi:bidirectional sugar transporter N3-like [Trifolium pratense]|uniref:bidirectional sugar transporter N3-like n=1 Tax=Trifolium pratense TaxID=57577 RepID=UPI001E690742|nr:bidirectional sugar transporter N3-like [Trifolium pratense]
MALLWISAARWHADYIHKCRWSRYRDYLHSHLYCICPTPTRRFTIILLIAMIVGLFAPIFLAIQFFVAKKNHVTVLGWICTSVSIVVFAAPLSAVIHVVRTRRVESMPIALIGCLIVSAGAWLIYGFLLKNIYIYLPNVIGLALGAIQLSVYGHYSRTGRRQPDIEVVEDVEEIVEIAPESDVVVELVEQHGRLVEVAANLISFSIFLAPA